MASPVRVVKFWTDYVNKKGRIVPLDKVEFCAVGAANRSTTVAYVSHVSNVRPPTGGDDIAALMAGDIWNQIKPAYEAWKKGSETPENGTPLGAWPAISQEQAQVLKTNGFRTVEEIANASDSIMQKIQLPNARYLVEQAGMFLAATDKAAVVQDLAAKDAEIARLREEQEEMKRILLEMQAEAQKPRRGRPPRDKQEAAA